MTIWDSQTTSGARISNRGVGSRRFHIAASPRQASSSMVDSSTSGWRREQLLGTLHPPIAAGKAEQGHVEVAEANAVEPVGVLQDAEHEERGIGVVEDNPRRRGRRAPRRPSDGSPRGARVSTIGEGSPRCSPSPTTFPSALRPVVVVPAVVGAPDVVPEGRVYDGLPDPGFDLQGGGDLRGVHQHPPRVHRRRGCQGIRPLRRGG